MLQRYRRQTVKEVMLLSAKYTSKLIREAKFSVLVVEAATNPNVVILKMPNAIVVVTDGHLARLSQLKRKGSNHSPLMSRNQASPSLTIFLKVPCKHQGRNRVWVHIP